MFIIIKKTVIFRLNLKTKSLALTTIVKNLNYNVQILI